MPSLFEHEDVSAQFTRPFERESFEELAPLARERAADGTHTDVVALDELHPRTRVTPAVIVAVLAGGAIIAVALLALLRTAASPTVAAAASEPVASRPPTALMAPSAVSRASVSTAPASIPAPAVPRSFVRIPVTSTPEGATVTVLDRNAPRAIGRTPVELALDPARSYDVIVAMPKHPTRLVHVTPSKVSHLAIDLRTPAGR